MLRLWRAKVYAAAVVTGLLGLSGATPVSAGAFLEKPGEGAAIIGGAFTDTVRAYDRYGRLVPVAPWQKFELTSYGEYGITDWLTGVASPSLFLFHQDGPQRSQVAAEIAEAGARVRLYQWDNSILSGQVIVRAPLAGMSARPFADTTRFVQVDARVGWGNGFELFGFKAFNDLQIGFRSNGNFGHEVRIDGTLGVWAFDPLLVLLQSFTIVTPGRIGSSLYLSQKVQLSAVYWITPTIGVQFGGLFGLKGVNSGAERGAVSALWVRF